MAPAEALAADPLPDAVAVMQLAVAASAHRAGGIKVRTGQRGLKGHALCEGQHTCCAVCRSLVLALFPSA